MPVRGGGGGGGKGGGCGGWGWGEGGVDVGGGVGVVCKKDTSNLMLENTTRLNELFEHLYMHI